MPNNLKRIVVGTLATGFTAGLLYLVQLSKMYEEIPRYLGINQDKYKTHSPVQAVRDVRTWDEAKDYLLSHLRYWDIHETDTPFETIHKSGKGVCRDGTIAGAALLSDDKEYVVSGLCLISRYERLADSIPYSEYGLGSHEVALIKDKKTGKWGSLGINASDCVEPKYSTIDELFAGLNRDWLWQFKEYFVVEFDPKTLVHGEFTEHGRVKLDYLYGWNGYIDLLFSLSHPSESPPRKSEEPTIDLNPDNNNLWQMSFDEQISTRQFQILKSLLKPGFDTKVSRPQFEFYKHRRDFSFDVNSKMKKK